MWEKLEKARKCYFLDNAQATTHIAHVVRYA